jgi:hypothetical protein
MVCKNLLITVVLKNDNIWFFEIQSQYANPASRFGSKDKNNWINKQKK